MTKLAEIMKLVAALGEYYSWPLTPGQVAMYAEDLMCLEPQQLAQAIISYRNDPRNDRFPLPVKLKAMVGAAVNPEDEAVQISGRILGAIASIGPYNTQRAREVIGEIGWQVVQMEGGWQTLCEVQTDDIPIRKAQWRNLAKSLIEHPRRSSSPALPGPKDDGPGKLLNFLKEIPR